MRIRTRHLNFTVAGKRIKASIMIGKCRGTHFELWPLAIWSYKIDDNYPQRPGRGYCAHFLMVSDLRIEVTS